MVLSRLPFRRMALTIAGFSLFAASAASLRAVTYTYTPTTGGGTDLWSAGTAGGWNATPVSAATTTLTFVGTNTDTVSGTYTSNNDLAGNFLLNILNLQGTGGATSGIINISGNPLEFISNGATTPTVNLSALVGGSSLTYNVANNVVLDNNIAFTGSGNAAFNFNGTISGAGNVTKNGNSLLTFGGANTYTGTTTVGAGRLTVSNLANGGLASGLGQSSSAAANLVLGGSGTLAYNGTAVGSTDRAFTMSSSATLNGTGGGLNFTSTGTIAQSGTASARTLSLSGAPTTGSNSLALTLTDSGTGANITNLTLNNSAGSNWIVSGANTYTGVTTLSNATLTATTLANGGATSSIGASNSAATNLVTNGTLIYSGITQATTDRLFTMAASTTLNAAAGGVNFTSTGTLGQSGASVRTLTLTGTPTAGTNTFAPLLTDNTASSLATSLSVTGAWTVTNSGNSYTGGTTLGVNGVVTAPTGGVFGTGAITFSGGTLQLQGTSAYAVSNQINMATAGGTINGNQSAVFSGDLNNSSTQSTTLTVNNSGTTTFGSTVYLGSTTGNSRTVTVGGSGAVVFGNAVNGAKGAAGTPLAGNVLYNGTGSLTLAGSANTYSGTTNVSSGALFINGPVLGTGNATGGTIGGSGSMAGLLTVSAGATLAPGATGNGSTAIFTVSGNLTINGAYSIDLAGTTAGTGYDRIATNGALTLNNSTSTLVLNSVTATFTQGDVGTAKFYILVDGAANALAANIRFSNLLTTGSTIMDSRGDTFTINYADNFDGGTNANDISLTLTGLGVVPEPSTYVGCLLLTGFMGWRWLRNRRAAGRVA